MRMELIAALLHSPEVLFLDEPTIGLDVVSQRKVQEFLKHYQAEQQITVILTSHYMKDVEALCRRAIISNEGAARHNPDLGGCCTGLAECTEPRPVNEAGYCPPTDPNHGSR